KFRRLLVAGSDAVFFAFDWAIYFAQSSVNLKA
ncbi:unnamed protein product, partial [marine sediment metagenome]